MNDRSGLRIWKVAVILLVVCNIGLVLTIWLKPGMKRGPNEGGPRDFVIQNLKFTDDQVKKYDELIKVHHQSMNQLRAEATEYRQQLFENLKTPGNGFNTDSLAQLIANNQKQIEAVTYKHFEQVRTICTEDQKKKFDDIIQDVMKQMNNPHHGGPHPQDRGGDGPPDGHGPPDGQQGPPPGGPQDH